MMFALVRLYYVCPLDSVTKTNQGSFCAKFKDDSHYDVDVVTTHGSYDVLEKLKQSLSFKSPRIVLNRCDAKHVIKLEQNDEFSLQTKVKEEISSENEDFECNTVMNVSASNEFIKSIISKTLTGEDNKEFLHDHNYDKIKDEEGSDWEMEQLHLKTEILHDDTFEGEGIEFNDSDQDRGYKEDEETPHNETSLISLSEQNWDDMNLIQSIIEVDHQTYSDHQYPVYAFVEEDNINTFAEMKINNIPLPEEPLPFYTNELQTKIPLPGRKNKHFCIYCKKLFSNLPRHLERIHAEKEAVQQFLSYPKGSLQRKAILKKIMQRGNFVYNTNRNYNNGQLLVARRPTKGRVYDAAAYIPCPECKAFYLKRTMRRHYARCNPNKNSKRRSVLPLSKMTYGQIHSEASEILRNEIFPYLQDGEPVKIIRYDSLAIAYGNYLCVKYTKLEHGFIKKYLRYAGRLLIAVKNVDPSVKDLTSLMVPSRVDAVVHAINNAAELDDNGQYKKLSVAWGLKKVCRDLVHVWKMECFSKKDGNSLQQADAFLNRFERAYEKEFYCQNVNEKAPIRRLVENDESFRIVQRTSTRWSPSTKAKFFKLFKDHLDNKTLPSNQQCEMAMKKLPGLQSKTVAAVKTAVMNEIRRRERKQLNKD